MKNLFLIVIFLFSLNIIAQKPCEYSVNVKDSIGIYKETKSAIVHEFIFGNTSKYVFFALALTDEMPSLTVQILQKSKDFLKVNCFNKNSRIFLQLENNKVVHFLKSQGYKYIHFTSDARVTDSNKNADVIIFDEATSALDAITETSVMDAIYRLDSNITMLVIAHRTSTLKNCNKIIKLENNAISILTPEDLPTES